MHRLFFFIILPFLVQQPSAGLLDSIFIVNPVISLEEAGYIRQQFESFSDDFCHFPGSIFNFKDDSICYNPVQEYIDNFDIVKDTSYNADSIASINYRIAMQTFKKFGKIEQGNNQNYSFSHTVFISHLEDEKPVSEKPFWIKQVERAAQWIGKHILLPLSLILSGSISKWSLLLKAVVIGVSIILFIFLVIIIAGFTKRIYPDIQFQNDRSRLHTNDQSTLETDWLNKAKEYASGSRYTDASDCLYRHLICWFMKRNKIRRYEWWTNRQFLHLIKERFNEDYVIAESIITTYERCVYGHQTIDRDLIRKLIDSASMLRGKSST